MVDVLSQYENIGWGLTLGKLSFQMVLLPAHHRSDTNQLHIAHMYFVTSVNCAVA